MPPEDSWAIVGLESDASRTVAERGPRVRLIAAVTEAEVIAEFLRAEIDSPRFGPRVRARLEADGWEAAVIERPDTSIESDNRYRSALLHGYRGVGGSAPLLEGLPESMAWTRVALTPSELGNVRYIDYPYWNVLSDGTRSPAHAAERIRAGVTALGRPNDAFHAVSARVCAGELLGTPILVAPDDESPLVILEGHTRITGMLIRPECLPAALEALVGRASGVRDWMYYGAPEGA